MGSTASVTKNERIEVRHAVAEKFKNLNYWYNNRESKNPECDDDDELADMIEDAIEDILENNISKNKKPLISFAGNKTNLKDEELRQAVPISGENFISSNVAIKKDIFMDSFYFKQWLNKSEADELFEHLKKIGENNRPKIDPNQNELKYPLWSIYYGYKRKLDGARALDRWGSYHESWTRVLEPTDMIKKYCDKLRKDFNLSDDSVNSIVVNYYFDGDTTYIPAHCDTTACLEENSSVYCLSLGVERDFILSPVEDCGKYLKENLNITKEWRVSHGDLFALGQLTNENYCHTVPKEKNLPKLRISVIFRSVSKSFIDLNAVQKSVEYASGNIHKFRAECIKTLDYNDKGSREHIADLIFRREISKKAKKIVSEINKNLFKEIPKEDLNMYYLGKGSTVLPIT